jgi:hypothetical protein
MERATNATSLGMASRGGSERTATGTGRRHSHGPAEGKAIGKVEGKVEASLRLLEKRFRNIPTAVVERIKATTDLTLPEAWFDAVITIASVKEFRTLLKGQYQGRQANGGQSRLDCPPLSYS